MLSKKYLLIFFLSCCFFILCPINALAQSASPVIKTFISNIAVQPDATLNITETVDVVTDGNIIRHGIYRDFLTDYPVLQGGGKHINFKLISTELDNNPSPNHIVNIPNGKRIYIGDPSILLPAGEHIFRLTYQVKQAIGFFSDHDELYWNVTGNAWQFPILISSARVVLPPGAAQAVIGVTGYTGKLGSTNQAYKIGYEQDGTIDFVTTLPLEPSEGLTIVVGWKKGFIVPPTKFQQYLDYLQENIQDTVALIGLIIVLLYYLIVWSRVRTAAHPGIVIPEYTPPSGLSPAALRYILDMGYDNRVFVAAIVNMAIKKFLVINQAGNEYSLTQINTDLNLLSGPEQKIAVYLFDNKKEVKLNADSHERIKNAIDAFKAELREEFQKLYFVPHSIYSFIGIALSLGTVLLSQWLAPTLQAFNLLCAIVAAFITIIVAKASETNDDIWLSVKLLLHYAVIFIAIYLFFFARVIPPSGTLDWFFILSLVLLAFTNAIFFPRLTTPTIAGQSVIDHIKGFKMFLAATEQEQLKFINPPEKTPELFDQYLPYAIALGVEEKWSKQFAAVLDKLAKEGQPYQPTWYNGPRAYYFNYGNFTTGLTNSMSAAVITSVAVSQGGASGGFSGFGGGGFSGGGFGGGGGGGW